MGSDLPWLVTCCRDLVNRLQASQQGVLARSIPSLQQTRGTPVLHSRPMTRNEVGAGIKAACSLQYSALTSDAMILQPYMWVSQNRGGVEGYKGIARGT